MVSPRDLEPNPYQPRRSFPDDKLKELAASIAQDGVLQPLVVRPRDNNGKYQIVSSPFVGTFYRAPGPEADPFVEVGNRIEKGQVLCIVEAMKLMNEIEAEYTGVIAAVLVENAQSVEYGQPLFKISAG